jgi:macrolide transport system ATP-binding/permease protein
MNLFRAGEQFAQDTRYAVRTMAGRPLFTAMAALSLALGIGANTAIYSFLDSILMRALPVQDPESLVVVNWHSKDHPAVAHSFSGSTYKDAHYGYTSGNFPFAAFESLVANQQVFSHTFAFSGAGRLNVQIHGQADLAAGQYVSGTFFTGLGVPPGAGRLIDPTDDRPGAPPVVVASYGYAQRRFGDPAKALGESILVNNIPFTIVGVAAPEFFGVNPAGAQDVFLPLHTNLLLERVFGADQTKYTNENYYWAQIMARLRPGVSLQQAEAAVAPVFRRFVEGTVRKEKERRDLPILHLQAGAGGLDSLRRQYGKPLYVLMTMVGLILAIACANIANLLLARAAGRRREMAVRLSLGAGRGRVIRQLLTESVLLAALGGVLGIAFARWGIAALTLLIANGRDQFTLHAELNWHVLAVTTGLALATGLLFGLAPAIQSTRVDLVTALKQTRAGESRVRLRSWMRVSLSQALIATQIAISLLLLVGAGLFARTLSNLNAIQVGFNRENVLLVTVNATQAGYKDDRLMRYYADLRKGFAELPGVRSATFSNYTLMTDSRNTSTLRVPGAPAQADGRVCSGCAGAPLSSVTILNTGPDFFSTMEIPLVNGRDITERDITGAVHVAVVNELFATRYFPNENPVGRHFQIERTGKDDDFEIIGVARTGPMISLKQAIPEMAYVPYTHNPRQSLGSMVYELRVAGEPLALGAAARRAVQQIDARVPVSEISTQARRIDQTIGQERTFAVLCTCFAILAVVIAGVGLYGTMAYSVARRTNEIGIRMALGAPRRRLLWMVLRDVLLIAAAGLAIGLPVAYATSHVVESFLFRMKANDPSVMAIAAVVLLAAAALAGYGPAWRASRVDPWTALRDE